jgi:sigma-B regulation protein RsbU (phosphoserine phosphatase)
MPSAPRSPEPFLGRGLAFKLSLFILTSTAVIYLVAFLYSYVTLRKEILEDVKKDALGVTMVTLGKIDNVLGGIEKVASFFARDLSGAGRAAPVMIKQMEGLLQANPEIFGVAVAFEPAAFDGRSRYYAPYIHRSGDGLKKIFIGSGDYDYFAKDWYQIPRELDRSLWSEPYVHEGEGGDLVATFSVPFYRTTAGEGRLAGIVRVDVSLDWLQDIVSRLMPEKQGYSFLISRNGVFVTHPRKEFIMRESVFSLADATQDEELRRIGRHMVWSGKGFVPLQGSAFGRDSWMFYAPLPSIGWSIGLVFPEKDLFGNIFELNRVILVIGGVGFLVLLVVIVVISGTITRPLRTLTEKAAEIARGNLDVPLPEIRSRDEVGELSRSFENMKGALKEYISNLAETTAAKERIESELKIARTIQMSFLPKKFPPFPERSEMDIYATLIPAKEVGGDLYDFFLLDGDHLFFSIGDVSGKGVPAALFMAVTKTLMKGMAERDLSPSDLLEAVNGELCRDNDTSMFVTIFCGVLDLKTGRLRCTGAGHPAPVLVRSKGEPEPLTIGQGFLLGALEGVAYKTTEIVLAPGDLLLLYTDGVTEAQNTNREFYGEERLRRIAALRTEGGPSALVDAVVADVRSFAGEAPQYDDITLLAIAYKGAGGGFRRDDP